jgi:assimilatory nitrate reductase catalytic subunit
VGVNAILIAIKSGWAMSVEAIGASLGVGTSCSGCRPELAALVAAAQQPRATE